MAAYAEVIEHRASILESAEEASSEVPLTLKSPPLSEKFRLSPYGIGQILAPSDKFGLVDIALGVAGLLLIRNL